MSRPVRAKTIKRKSPLDVAVYIAAFIAPFFELPQLFTVYSNHSAKDVSVITWGCFAAASGVWLIYAIKNRLRPLPISYLLFFTIESVIFIGVVIYR